VLERPMKLYYETPEQNFGDDLNPWLWPRVFPKALEDYGDDAFHSLIDEV
jgi:hypothetical protein